ncbi:MAG TPA: S49 family peptidase [Terracidiphilus sp.]|jgi:signal peptide peptidase SppA
MPDQMPIAMEVFSDKPWAITRDAMEMMCRVADHPDFEAAARLSASGIDTDVPTANGTAVIDIRGALFRYRSIWTWLLGGTSVEEVSAGLQSALDDPMVRSIVLSINSPGGQIDGINELANSIRAANSQKPVTAYVGGLGASGAYWLASAAGKIVADETAQLGSIGVLATVIDSSAADQKSGVKRYDVVSSQSPLKRTDPGTDEGRAQLQSMVDAMAQIFIGKVAQFRGTTPERVESDFGRGAVMMAPAAVAAGMADEMGSLQGAVMGGDRSGMPVRQIRDKPGLRVGAQADGPFDEEELEEETDEEQINNEQDCTPPPALETQSSAKDDEDDKESEEDGGDDDPDEDDDDEDEEGKEKAAAAGSSPEGDGDLLTPTEERQRIAAILTSEEAKGREELARALALETSHSPEVAKKLLLAAPVAKANSGFHARMNNVPNPQVGVQSEASDDKDTPTAEAQRILAFVPKDRRRVHIQ